MYISNSPDLWSTRVFLLRAAGDELRGADWILIDGGGGGRQMCFLGHQPRRLVERVDCPHGLDRLAYP